MNANVLVSESRDAIAPAKSWFTRLLETDTANSVLFGQRLLLAAVMLPHGLQKTVGWFGGYGFSATMNHFTSNMHIPGPIALLVILAESVGAVLLGLGLLSRVAALGVISVMIGAVLTSHLEFGFFMNWFGNQQGEGFEYHLLALALAIPLMLLGGGKHALDTKLVQRLPR